MYTIVYYIYANETLDWTEFLVDLRVCCLAAVERVWVLALLPGFNTCAVPKSIGRFTMKTITKLTKL